MSKDTTLAGTCKDTSKAWQKYVVLNEKKLSTIDYEIDKDLPKDEIKTLIIEKTAGKYVPSIGKDYPTGTKLKILDIKIKSVNVLVGNKSKTIDCASVSIENAKGLLPLRIIKKPTNGSTQARVASGAVAQSKIFPYVKKLADENDLGLVYQSSFAIAGSGKTDVILSVAGTEIHIEVKGDNKNTGKVVMYDKTYTRGEGSFKARNPDPIDEYALCLFPKTSTDDKAAGPFETIMNMFRDGRMLSKDVGAGGKSGVKSAKEFGFAGDEGVIAKAGKFPSEFTSDDSTVRDTARLKIIEKLKKSGDDYFAVVNDNNVKMFFVSDKNDTTNANILKLPPFPSVLSFTMRDYGGVGKKKLRVGIEVVLKL
jgi:hypothetical protein